MDAVYFQNAHIILHDDAAFRFESTPDGLFTVQLLDTDRSEVPPGVCGGHRQFKEALWAVEWVKLGGAIARRHAIHWGSYRALHQFAIFTVCSFIRPAGDLSLCC